MNDFTDDELRVIKAMALTTLDCMRVAGLSEWLGNDDLEDLDEHAKSILRAIVEKLGG